MMTSDLKNKLKIAAAAAAILAGMIAYKLIHDRRKQTQKSKDDEEN